MDDINVKFKDSLIWSIFGQFGYFGITLLTNILLARLLSPNEFGIIAIATFFIAISRVLTEAGLSGALVRKQDSSEEDYSTIFIFNLAVSISLYVILFSFSSSIEKFYQISNLSLYIRVLSVILIINSFQIIQNVRLVKKLEYKRISLYTLISILISSLISILLGFLGYGIWALISLQLLNSLILTLIYWYKEKGLEIYVFSKKSFKELYSFGVYTTLASLLNTAFDNIYQLLLGKYFSIGQTGYYYQAKKLTEVPIGIINSTTLGVVFSTLSNLQNEKKKFDNMYNSIIRVFTILIGLLSLILFLYSREILYLLFGTKWLAADFYMKVLALSSFFVMQEMFKRILFKVFNQTHKILILELVKKSINLLTIFIGIYYKSLEFLMFGYLVTCILSYILNYYVSKGVYLTNNFFYELFYTLKVTISGTIIYCLLHILNTVIKFEFLFRLLYLPFIIIAYIYFLKLMKVVDFKEDLRLIKSLKKHR